MKLRMLEKVDLINRVIELAVFRDTNEVNCTYLELGKVVYTSVQYKPTLECPKSKDDEGNDTEFMDIFLTYDMIIDSGLWDILLENKDVQRTVKMIDKRYEEVKQEVYNRSNFENELLSKIEDLKSKFIEKMDTMDIDKLELLSKSVPSMLSNLSGSQKETLDKLSNIKK